MKKTMTTSESNLAPLPYKEIGAYPQSFSQGNIIKWFIDGLGYRYYWATESLSPSDLSYRINDQARSTLETLEHILDIAGFILRVSQQQYNTALTEQEKLDFNQIRYQTLNALKKASQLIAQIPDEHINALEIKVQKGDYKFTMPMWNLLNGPISDALYHVGQIVSFRRASGNPINPKVDIFMGKNKE